MSLVHFFTPAVVPSKPATECAAFFFEAVLEERLRVVSGRESILGLMTNATDTTKKTFAAMVRGWFKRKPPKHDCRDFLPVGNKVAEGVQMDCLGCGATNVRYNYDQDWSEDMAWFCGWLCGWRRISEPTINLFATDA